MSIDRRGRQGIRLVATQGVSLGRLPGETKTPGMEEPYAGRRHIHNERLNSASRSSTHERHQLAGPGGLSGCASLLGLGRGYSRCVASPRPIGLGHHFELNVAFPAHKAVKSVAPSPKRWAFLAAKRAFDSIGIRGKIRSRRVTIGFKGETVRHRPLPIRSISRATSPGLSRPPLV